jgi:T5orf172 domain
MENLEDNLIKYKYFNIPLIPSIIAELALQLYPGKMVKRDELAKGVMDYHLSKGGLKPDAESYTGSIKSALKALGKAGKISKVSYGYWQFCSTESPEIDNFELIENNKPISVEPEYIQAIADQIFGEGSGTIYLYYYDTYKKHALLNNSDIWECKIGRTDRDPLERVLSQASTALPEKPHISILIYTDNPGDLEKNIHTTLKLRKREIIASPGNEWFFTSPDEVTDLVKFIIPSIKVHDTYR